MLSQLLPALRSTIVLAVYTGILFPLAVWAAAQILFPLQSNGSLIADGHGRVIGSALIGQTFTKPNYFHPRPSAAGSGYAGEASGGTNLGPTSKKLIFGDSSFDGVKTLAVKYRTVNSLTPAAMVPVDAVTRSASGLDPDISLQNALLQAPRVAKARQIADAVVIDLIHQHAQDRQFGFLGEPRVNVLLLNLALDHLNKN